METTCRHIEDAEVKLDDGSDYTNAILRNCRILFDGGPVQIDGALFLECTFAYGEGARGVQGVEFAIRRSLYAEGFRTLVLHKDGNFHAV